jgi:hypothetical protein
MNKKTRIILPALIIIIILFFVNISCTTTAGAEYGLAGTWLGKVEFDNAGTTTKLDIRLIISTNDTGNLQYRNDIKMDDDFKIKSADSYSYNKTINFKFENWTFADGSYKYELLCKELIIDNFEIIPGVKKKLNLTKQ